MEDNTHFSSHATLHESPSRTTGSHLSAIPSHSLHVGDTTAKLHHKQFSPDLPLASITLLLSSLNLTSSLSAIGFAFAMIAFALSLGNVLALSRTPVRVSRRTTVLILFSSWFILLICRSVAFTEEASQHVPKAGNIEQHFRNFDLASHAKSSFDAVKIPMETGNTAHPVNALTAVERSQHASANAGDADTEAHENSIDETRVGKESHDFNAFDRHVKPPNLNGTFIVNTHVTESW